MDDRKAQKHPWPGRVDRYFTKYCRMSGVGDDEAITFLAEHPESHSGHEDRASKLLAMAAVLGASLALLNSQLPTDGSEPSLSPPQVRPW